MADITPPDYETPIGRVRLLIPDINDPYTFSDAQILVFLSMNADNEYLAAAVALETQASYMTLIGGASTVKTDDLSISEKDGINILLSRARDLRNGVALTERDDFQIVYPVVDYCTPEGSAHAW